MPDVLHILNLNNYRNWQSHLSNQLKQTYKEMLGPQLEGSTFPTPCVLFFRYYAKTAVKLDIENPCSILCKFFCDAATAYGCWEDDNHTYVPSVAHIYAGKDAANPRCEVDVVPLEELPNYIQEVYLALLNS